MVRTTVLLIVARLVQIACGILVLGFAVAVKTDGERYHHYNQHSAQFATIFTGAGIAILGALGLFVCKRSIEGLIFTALIFFADCCALALCWGSGIVSTEQ